MTLRLVAVSVMAFLFSWCKASTDAHFVREKIPIEIQSGKPVIIKISSLSGNGWNEVGIRCLPEIWKALMDEKSTIAVRLLSSSKNGTTVINIAPGDHKLWPIESYYYLFSISGKYRSSASVEITFPSAPQGVTHAEMIILKTPSDTGF